MTDTPVKPARPAKPVIQAAYPSSHAQPYPDLTQAWTDHTAGGGTAAANEWVARNTAQAAFRGPGGVAAVELWARLTGAPIVFLVRVPRGAGAGDRGGLPVLGAALMMIPQEGTE